jgi:hypothetical protein
MCVLPKTQSLMLIKSVRNAEFFITKLEFLSKNILKRSYWQLAPKTTIKLG